MPLRDDREAARARIEALERDLSDAKERAERAEAEAAQAREAAATKAEREASADSERPASKREKSRAERKREKKKKRREAEAAAEPSADASGWAPSQRRVYQRASCVLALVAYAGVAVVTVAERASFAEEAISPILGIAFGVALGVLILGHAAIGYFTRAPGIFNGAMITLLSVSVTLAAAMAIAIGVEEVLASFLSPSGLLFAQVIGALVALVVGAFVSAAWAASAASSDAVGGD